MAVEHQELSYKIIDEGELEISIENQPVLRFDLNEAGQPTAFSRFNDDFSSKSVTGPVEAYGDIKLWKHVGAEDGKFRSHNLEFFHSPTPASISFDPPEDLNDIDLDNE